MKIAVIYGTQRKAKSSTYNIAQQFIKELAGEDVPRAFFLPQSMPHFCLGCWNCFTDFKRCPHYGQLQPILEAMLEAELLIFTAPVYVYHAPGQMKAFLDHFGYQWMPHQPRREMFGKQALVISTAAGAGTKSACKDITDSLTFWGISHIHTFRRNVHASDWDTVNAGMRGRIAADIRRLAAGIKARSGRLQPSLRVKALFYAMRFMNKKFKFNAADVQYWEAQGWLARERPW